MNSRCTKFQANIFNKSKCQNCFRSKDQHSSEALENSKATRKISKCGYLFVAPDTFDFGSPLDRTRRWQRRFFVLFDDGELSYSVDENVNTVPQGVIDMNLCKDVFGAENLTGHEFSIAVKTPDSVTFIKGTNKEETNRWHDVLVMYPRSSKTKHRRSPTYPSIAPPEAPAQKSLEQNGEVPPPSATVIRSRFLSQRTTVSTNHNDLDHPSETSDRRTNRRHTSYVPRNWDADVEAANTDTSEKNTTTSAFADETYTRSQDAPEINGSREGIGTVPAPVPAAPLTYRGVRSLKHKKEGHYQDGMRKSNSMHDLSSADKDDSFSQAGLYRSRSRDNLYGSVSRRRPVSVDSGDLSTSNRADSEPDLSSVNKMSSKNLYKSLRDSLQSPISPLPKPSYYVQLAGIPMTRPIDDLESPASPPQGRRRSAGDVLANRSGSSSSRWRADIACNSPPSSMSSSPPMHLYSPSPSRSPRQRHRPSHHQQHQQHEHRAVFHTHESKLPTSSCDSIGQADTDITPAPPAAQRSLFSETPPERSRSASAERRPRRSATSYEPPPSSVFLYNGKDKNETDEHKMAKSSSERAARLSQVSTPTNLSNKSASVSPARPNPTPSTHSTEPYTDLMYMKKGWLLKQNGLSKEWEKQWFVLSGRSLTYYKDSSAEDAAVIQGTIDIASCYQVNEMEVSRNYGFILKSHDEDFVLSAMTSGIRNNWVQAIRKCMELSMNSDPAAGGDGHPNEMFTPSHAELGSYTSNRSRSNSASSGSSSARRQKLSCTWPYNQEVPNPDSSPSPDQTKYRSRSVEEGASRTLRDSNDSLRSSSRELSEEEQKELDHVERNIRRIHRKSLTEYSREHKPQHFDKFENGSAFGKDDKSPSPMRRGVSPGRRQRHDSSDSNISTPRRGISPASTPGRRLSPTSTPRQGSSPVSTPRRGISPAHTPRRALSPPHTPRRETSPLSRHDDTPQRRNESQSPHSSSRRHFMDHDTGSRNPSTPRAPSAKIKDKSRAKSPRAKSPPPFVGESEDIDNEESKSSMATPRDNIIEQKWKEVESLALRSAPSSSSMHSASLSAGDQAVVELLETEVESLKARLEQAEREQNDMTVYNTALKTQLRSVRQNHQDSLTDLDGDHSRYLTQIADMQDELEHATSYLSNQLAEQQSKASSQLETLKKQLEEARCRINSQDTEIKLLKSRLGDAKKEESRSRQVLEDETHSLEVEIERLHAETRSHAAELERALQATQTSSSEIELLQAALRTKEEEVDAANHEIEELRQLQQELGNREDRIQALERELTVSQCDLTATKSKLAEATSNQDEVYRHKMFALEAEFTRDRQELQKQVKHLQDQLDSAHKQSNMADSLNSNMADILREKDETMAQLEEKLIENDTKIDSLKKELRLVLRENTDFQHGLEESCSKSANQVLEMEELRKTHAKTESEMLNMREELEHQRIVEREISEENATLQAQLDNYSKQVEDILSEKESLRERLLRHKKEQEEGESMLHADLTALQKENHQLKSECSHLQAQNETLSTQSDQAFTLKLQCDELTQQLKSQKCLSCEKLQRENEKLRLQVEEIAELNAENEELSQQFEELCSKNKQLEKQCADFEKMSKEHEELLEKSGKLEAELNEAMKEAEKLTSERDDFQSKMSEQLDELKEAQTQMDLVQDQLQHTEDKSVESQSDIDTSLSEIRDIMRRSSVAMHFGDVKDPAQLTDVYEHLIAEVRHVRNQLREAHGENDKLELDRARLAKQFAAIEADYQSQLALMSSRIEDLTSKLTAAERKSRKLQRKRSKQLKKEGEEAVKEEEVQASPPRSNGGEAAEEILSIAVPLQSAVTAPDDSSDTISQPDELEPACTLTDHLAFNDEIANMKNEQELMNAQMTKLREQAKGLQDRLRNCVCSQQAEMVQDMEARADQLQKALDICRNKLTAVVREVEDVSLPSPAAFTSIISAVQQQLQKALNDAADVLHETRDEEVAVQAEATKSICSLSERLWVEADTLERMSRASLHQQQNDACVQEWLLCALLTTQGHTTDLVHKVSALLDQSNIDNPRSSAIHKDCLYVSSRMLAERVILQAKMQLLLEGQKGQSHNLDIDAAIRHSAVLASHAAKQGDLWGHLQVSHDTTSSASHSLEGIAEQLRQAEESLRQHVHILEDVCDAYQTHSVHILTTALQSPAGTTHTTADTKQTLGDQLQSSCHQAVDKMLTGLESKSSPDMHQRTSSIVQGLLDEELNKCIDCISKIHKDHCQKYSDYMDYEIIESVDGAEQLQGDVLEQLSNIIAEKCVLKGQILYLAEQVQGKSDKLGSHEKLTRSDSGLSSTPTSPNAKQTSGEPRLSQQVEQLRAISQHLQSSVSSNHEVLDSEVIETMKSLDKIDSDLQQQMSLKSRAAAITQEVLHQAQLRHLATTLSTKYEQQVSQLQKEVDHLQSLVGDLEKKAASESQVTAEQIDHLQRELASTKDSRAAEVEELRGTLEKNKRKIVEGSQVQELEEDVDRLAKVTELSAELEHRNQEISMLKEKYEKHIAVLENDLRENESEVQHLHQTKMVEIADYESKISVLEERLASLRQELDELKAGGLPDTSIHEQLVQDKVDAERMAAAKEKEASNFQAVVKRLEEEIRNMQRSQLELQAAERALKAAAEASTSESARFEAEVKRLRTKLEEEQAAHLIELDRLRADLGGNAEAAAEAVLNTKLNQVQMQMQNMQMDYEQELAVQRAAHRRELARSKDDMLQLLEAAEANNSVLDEETIRTKYMQGMDHIKEVNEESCREAEQSTLHAAAEMYERGFAAMERSHQRVMMEMRRSHKQELDALREEKEQVLTEETHATQAALDAMKKAHESELQRERSKFLDLIAKTYSQNDVESLQRQHEADLELIQAEMRQLSEQYSLKCLENATLEDRLVSQSTTLTQCRRRITDLMTRNEELNLLVKHEVERLHKLVSTPAPAGGLSPTRPGGEPEDANNLKVAMKIKEVEIAQLQQEVTALKDQLENTTQELEDGLERYHALHTEHAEVKSKLQAKVARLKHRLRDDGDSSDRNPSVFSEGSQADGDSDEDDDGEYDDESGNATGASDTVSSLTSKQKKSSWRQANPERARSSPGLTPAIRLSLIQLAGPVAERPRLGRRNTYTESNISSFQERF